MLPLGLFLAFCFPSVAQKNLLRNGGFEDHAEQKCLHCNTIFGQYPSVVYHWDNGEWYCLLCDKNYKRNSDEIANKICPVENIPPKEGNAMIEMAYMPMINGLSGIEGASYLSARTTQPMEVGSLYEISFWIYLQNTKRADPEWTQHLGISLLPKNLKVHGLYRHRLVLPYLPIDTVIYDTWYPVKWRVRPLCTSNYLMIGVYADNIWPRIQGFADVRYYLDNVSIIEIPTPTAIADSSVYYCSRYDPKKLGIPPSMDTEILLFENKAFDLGDAHKQALDSFAVFAREYPDLIFEISGHTDSIGSDNLVLSQQRAQSVFQYLTEVQQVPSFRFFTLAKAGTSPYRPNHTEEGRRLNRRAQIRQTNLSPSNIFYREALRAMEKKEYAYVFLQLHKWLKTNENVEGRSINLLFDPRFDALHQDPRWKTIDQKIRASYRSYKYPLYAFQLDSMNLVQKTATSELTAFREQGGLNALPGYIPEIDTVFLEILPLSDAEIAQKQAAHFATLQVMLGKMGWPKNSEMGDNAGAVAQRMMLQSNHLVSFLKWLPVLEKACLEGEAYWMQYAILFDRCNLALGKPQRYATQVEVMEGGQLRVLPWEGNEQSVNEYRAKIGLPLLSAAVGMAMEGE